MQHVGDKVLKYTNCWRFSWITGSSVKLGNHVIGCPFIVGEAGDFEKNSGRGCCNTRGPNRRETTCEIFNIIIGSCQERNESFFRSEMREGILSKTYH
jgi:hypothetical protein